MTSANTAARLSPRAERKDAQLEAAPKPRRRWRVTTFVSCVLALVLLFGLVGFQAAIVANQSRLDDLDSQLDEAARANQQLRLQVAELEAPDRIRDFATTALGMVEPDRVEYLEPISQAELDPGGAG